VIRARLAAVWLRLVTPLGPPATPAHGTFGLVRGGRARRWLRRLVLGRRVGVVVRVEGDVQGVGYRAWVRRAARRAGVRGWVRNVTDGSVEVLLYGRAGRVERLARRCWRGPRRAAVRALHARLTLERPDGRFAIEPSRVAPGSTEQRFLAVRELLGPLLAEPNAYDERRAGNLRSLRRAARERNVYASRPFRAGTRLLVLAGPASSTAYSLTTRADQSEIDFASVRNKDLARERLLAAGLPVARGAAFGERGDALAWFRSYARPVVVKPTAASKGRGVSVDVRTVADVEAAWDQARRYGDRVIVEEVVRGIDLRVTVVSGTAVSAMVRFPAHVVGDGRRTVARLHARRDRLRRRNPRLRKGRLPLDAAVRRTLWRQGYRLDDVPAEGAVVFLSLASNTSRGAEGINVLPLVHPDVLLLAEQACAACAPEGVVGIDLMLERIDASRLEQRCVVGEVNMNPTMYGSEYPMYGAPVDVAARMLLDAFPERPDDDDYLLERARVELTGRCTPGLERELARLAADGSVALVRLERRDTERALVELEGRAHELRAVVDELNALRVDDDGGVVDGWRRERDAAASDAPAPSDAAASAVAAAGEVGAAALWDVRPARDAGPAGPTGPAWDLRVCAERLRRSGLVVVERDGWLLDVHDGARRALTGLWHTSRFAREATVTREAAWAVARYAGLPVPAGHTFVPAAYDHALAALGRLGHDAVVVDTASGDAWRVRSAAALERRWPGPRRPNARVRLERHVDGVRLAFAVVDGRVAGAARCHGAAGGDAERAPGYAAGLDAFDRVTGLAPGEGVHPGWAEVAVRVVGALAGLRYAVVVVAVQDPTRPPPAQDWTLLGIDAHPSARRFHAPDAGPGADVLAAVIARLVLGDTTRWYAQSADAAARPGASA